MARKRFGNSRPTYKAEKDVGLYVFSDNDALMENVNSVLKRKGIIGVTDPTGMVRYYVDGRRNLTKAANQLQHVVTGFNESLSEQDEFEFKQLFDVAAQRVFMRYDIDMSLIGSNIVYIIVHMIVSGGFLTVETLKDMWAAYSEEWLISYSQMVRNIRYALSHSRMGKMRSRTAIRHLATEVQQLMCDLEGDYR